MNTSGWPADRLRPLRDERAALQAGSAAIDLAQPYSCESIERARTWLAALDAEGELAWLRGRQAGKR